MPQIIVSKKTNKAHVKMGRDTIVLKRTIPTVYAYDSTYKEFVPPYVDGGLYNQEGVIADAGLYNTSTWEIVWDGGTP